MIATLKAVDIEADTDAYGNVYQRVTIRLENAGVFMPTDELQCLVGGLVRLEVGAAKSTDALPPTMDSD